MEPTQKLEIELDNNDATILKEFMDEIPKQGKYWALMFGVLMYQKLQPHASNGTYPLSRQDCNKLMDHIEDLYQHMVEEKKEETV
jgi:hypothetical protein